MDYINLIINNPASLVAIISLGFNLFLIRYGYKINAKSFASSDLIKMKNKDLDSLYSKIENAQKENNELISNIKKEHFNEIENLNKEIEKLKNKVKSHNKRPLNYHDNNVV